MLSQLNFTNLQIHGTLFTCYALIFDIRFLYSSIRNLYISMDRSFNQTIEKLINELVKSSMFAIILAT